MRTDNDDKTIATAARKGGSAVCTTGYKTPEAIGIAKVLYPNAHTKFN